MLEPGLPTVMEILGTLGPAMEFLALGAVLVVLGELALLFGIMAGVLQDQPTGEADSRTEFV